jgi:hypothetical protein
MPVAATNMLVSNIKHDLTDALQQEVDDVGHLLVTRTEVFGDKLSSLIGKLDGAVVKHIPTAIPHIDMRLTINRVISTDHPKSP